jgi:lysyl-tRNA synthetase class 2
VIGVISGLSPAFPRRLEVVEALLDPTAARLAAGTTALLGFALVVLGRGIALRRRAAYLGALALLVISAVAHLVKGLDVEEAIVAVAVAILLVRSRGLFTASVSGRWRVVLRLGVVLMSLNLAFGMLSLALGAARPHVPVKPVRLLVEVLAYLGGAGGGAHFHGVARALPVALSLAGFVTAGLLLFVACAPHAETTASSDDDRARVRRLSERPDGDTLDPFALRGDKHYVFSADHRAALAYRYVGGVGLASGDPVGAPDAFPDTIRRFLAHCDERGWRPAVMGVRADRLDLYQAAGLRTLYLGDEAIVDVAEFSLDGRAMRPVRQAVNRTLRHGITTEIHREGDLDDGLRTVLIDIAVRSRNGEAERGFSMALDQLLAGRDPDCIVIVARDPQHVPVAFERYVTCRAGTGLSLDAMRREPTAAIPNGINERMIVDVIEWARAHDIKDVSLNFAFCKNLIEADAALSTAERAQAWIVRRLDPHFQISSLLAFNAKFHPRWIPRYLAYRTPGELPLVGAAAGTAEGFLPFDRHRARPQHTTRQLTRQNRQVA